MGWHQINDPTHAHSAFGHTKPLMHFIDAFLNIKFRLFCYSM